MKGKTKGCYVLKKAERAHNSVVKAKPPTFTTVTQTQVQRAKRKANRQADFQPPEKRKTVIIKDEDAL